MGIGFTVFGLFILAFGLLVCYAKSAQIKASETFSGVITGFYEKKQRSHYIVETLYCPVVEYQNDDGKVISAEHYDYFRDFTLSHGVGELVLIYVDPHSPRKFFFVDECKGPDLKGIAISAVGAAFMIVGLVALAIS